MQTKTRLFVLIGISTITACTRANYAQEAEVEIKSPAKIARQVYDLLLTQYRDGETGGLTRLESLNNWSLRILHAEFGATTLGEGPPSGDDVQRSIRDHVSRMQGMEQVVEARYKADSASKAELLAARFYRLESNGMEPAIKAIQQLIQPVEGDFEIKMPKVDESKPLKEVPPSVVIDIDARGKISIGGKEFARNQLGKELKKLGNKDPRTASAVIRAHPDCPYRDVVQAINVCTKSGIRSVSFTNINDAKED